jgi:hypothetical protein
MYDTLLFLHVLSAFVLVTSQVIFTTMVLAARRFQAAGVPVLRLQKFGVPAVSVGAFGVLVFGVWLAIYVDGYELWDAWILAAFALWATYALVGSYAGRQVTAASEREGGLSAEPRILRVNLVVWALIVLFLLDMFFKPGA